MARFLRVGNWRVFDTTRILAVEKSKTFITEKPSVRIAYYTDFDFENYFVKPMWDWKQVRFNNIIERDVAYEKLMQYVPKNVAETLIINDI